jgi:hypothetical protein
MGYNRSALVAGMILVELGMPGVSAVERLRARRPGALYNGGFASFIESLAPACDVLGVRLLDRGSAGGVG